MVKVLSTEIIDAEDTEVFDIEVEGDHSFIVGDVVAHNCKQCGPLDGKVFPLDNIPRYPQHPNERCILAPVTKASDFIDAKSDPRTRFSMDGDVPVRTTYEEWLKTKPASFQKEVLGNTDYKLWKRGGLELKEFIAADGTEMNIRQLRARYPKAFKKAGVDA